MNAKMYMEEMKTMSLDMQKLKKHRIKEKDRDITQILRDIVKFQVSSHIIVNTSTVSLKR